MHVKSKTKIITAKLWYNKINIQILGEDQVIFFKYKKF